MVFKNYIEKTGRYTERLEFELLNVFLSNIKIQCKVKSSEIFMKIVIAKT